MLHISKTDTNVAYNSITYCELFPQDVGQICPLTFFTPKGAKLIKESWPHKGLEQWPIVRCLCFSGWPTLMNTAALIGLCGLFKRRGGGEKKKRKGRIRSS